MIYELRRTVLKRRTLDTFRSLVLDHLWPGLAARGATPVCFLSGISGITPEETYLIVGYPDIASWERLQWAGPKLLDGAPSAWQGLDDRLAERRDLIVEENVQLMAPAEGKPKTPFPVEDRRAVYGLRRFTIRSEDWPELVRASWTLWRSWEDRLDSPILGMFRGLAVTDPLPVTLLTGYRSVAHWEQTRDLFKGGTAERPADVPEETWQEILRDYRIRNADLPVGAYVCHVRAHWPA